MRPTRHHADPASPASARTPLGWRLLQLALLAMLLISPAAGPILAGGWRAWNEAGLPVEKP